MATAVERLPLATVGDFALPATAMLVLAGMVAPIGPGLLDFLLSLSLSLSLLVLVVAASNQRALDFSAFPTVLLIATLLRLSLNVASTRLILLHGDRGAAAAGVVIESFGRVIVGDNYAVGLVVFIVLAIINFAVVTKGASRVAEVAARFTLDAMPGKQMAIDADLNSGSIGEEEARRRRRELTREADFHAAMDGIGKFVRGDAVAAILIMAINLVAGLFIGVVEHGLSLTDALRTYTILTVGDGLGAQIPALLTSTAAGVIVSRTAGEHDLASTVSRELFGKPGVLAGAAALLGLIAVMPGLPHLPFLAMAVALLLLAYRSRALVRAAAVEGAPVKPKAAAAPSPWPDILCLELGGALVPFVNEPWKLADKIQALRPKLRLELGVTLPAVRIVDNLTLDQHTYRILLRGAEVARGQLRSTMSLAVPGPKGPHPQVKGLDTVEPAFGLPALWITGDQVSVARSNGYTVVDALTALVTHFAEIVRANAADIVTRKDVETMLEAAQKSVPRIVEELSGLNIHLGAVYRILQLLLAQRISVLDLPIILEALAAEGASSKDPTELAERIRPHLGRIICEPLRRPDGSLPVLVVDPVLEEPFFAALADGSQVVSDPAVIRTTTEAVRRAINAAAGKNMEYPAIVVAPQVRRMFERIARGVTRHAVVLGATDLPPGLEPLIVGRIGAP
ncbi:MAG TPA: flagellar biosynthesis protein FlhA [Candidatus Binataceae bacterium]|nr:flagellar biosynthesis protein FlhA [Candidatus Binataceae bacterium]